ncbi:GntR family transcriptional regulator [Janthinobacterium fluminis]|uniref:GntR family transcriptional regulator n=1 Tax=Janthinobacterium fluminis TaxID=2987524 RepID=A0ABT5JXI9_9BURK|nr:GntR family transcriptional regulator [Janthinobacterium fluminis]MDC8757460.1 GntR family transcriptional regulator [Janthinobacterium fluminis]
MMNAATPLVRQSVTSLYEQIAAQLRDEALSGLYDPSGKLPSEAQLCARFAVSRITVRLALQQLAQQGTVERKQGKGTYVAGRQVRHGLDAVRSFHDSLLMQGLKPEMRLLSRAVVALPAHLPARFGGQATHALLLERLHLVDGEPIAFGASYLPRQLAALGWEETQRQPNYALLKSLDGHGVARADVAIGARLADRELASVLKVKTGSALLVMTRTSTLLNGDCCDYSVFYIRPERYEFVASCAFKPG